MLVAWWIESGWMSNPKTARFERHSFEFGDLVDTLAEDGIVWGRDFELVGFPSPAAFELSFRNEELADRASMLWKAKAAPRTAKEHR
jgi:hypothetical protein